jgi:hypothetical protein
MASKDLSLDLVEKLDLLKKNGTDYLLVTIEPGKNSDRADVWHELRSQSSAENLVKTCFNLFATMYEKDDLVDLFLMFCEELDENDGPMIPSDLPPKTKKKKRNPPK